MGNTHTVSIWEERRVLGWGYTDIYNGESLTVAFIKFISAKIKGNRCVRWEWR